MLIILMSYYICHYYHVIMCMFMLHDKREGVDFEFVHAYHAACLDVTAAVEASWHMPAYGANLYTHLFYL